MYEVVGEKAEAAAACKQQLALFVTTIT